MRDCNLILVSKLQIVYEEFERYPCRVNMKNGVRGMP